MVNDVLLDTADDLFGSNVNLSGQYNWEPNVHMLRRVSEKAKWSFNGDSILERFKRRWTITSDGPWDGLWCGFGIRWACEAYIYIYIVIKGSTLDLGVLWSFTYTMSHFLRLK